jgi:plastocyanin
VRTPLKSTVVILAAFAAWLSFVRPMQGAIYTNTIQSFSFDPPTRTISAGDTVVWINLDGVGHTVTGDFDEEPICGPGFLYQNNTCVRTFGTTGTFTYHCEPHESMVGTIVVLPPDNFPPNVVITSPAAGASLIGPTNVLIRATAIDPDGVVLNVTFFDGSTPLGSDTRAPFEVNASLGIGRHTLTAVAFDDGGAQTRSFPVTVSINPPLRILRLSVGVDLVLTSTPTNYGSVLPEFKVNLGATNWLPLPVRSNRFLNGALETFCDPPAVGSAFIRIRSP